MSQNRRTISTQLSRRPTREQTERIWEEQQQRQDDALPEGHGQIVRDDRAPEAVAVRPPGAHVDEFGNPISPHHRIQRAASGHHLPPQSQQVLDRAPAPAHQVGMPPPPQGSRTVAGHSDPRRTPQSVPQPVVHRIAPASPTPAGAQVVATQHGMQSMGERSQHQGGVVHVGGQPVQAVRSSGMPASVYAVPGDVTPAQAAAMLRQGGHAPMGPASQFQGGARAPGASVGVGAQIQPMSGRLLVPGAATVVRESSIATIAMADDATVARELEAAGMQDRIPAQRRATTLPRRATAEDLAPARTLDLTVVLSAFSRPQLLKAQIDALRKGRVLPRHVIVLVGHGVPVADALVEGFPWTQKGQQIPHNTYGLPVSPWERFRVAARVDTKYVCVLDDDCIPGSGWLEACISALEGNLDCVIAAAGSRLDEKGEEIGYRGPAVDEQSQGITWSELEGAGGDHLRAAFVDVGELGWMFQTQWLAPVVQGIPAHEPPYGWQLHVSAALADPALPEPIRTVVLPYDGPDRSGWGATLPAQQDGLHNLSGMDVLRSEEFQVYRQDGWELCETLPLEKRALSIPKPGDPKRKPELPPGAYFDKRQDRYLTPADRGWSAAVYEALTGETWDGPADEGDAEDGDVESTEITQTPQGDTSSGDEGDEAVESAVAGG